VLITSLNQLNGLYAFLGSIIVAPLFFPSLLHPFKRPEIATFRWCVLAMWLFAVLGMSLFGLPEGKSDPNQLHVLFIPLMTAYGLAFISVLWSRLGITSNVPLVTNGHLVIAVVFSVVPTIFGLIPQIGRSLHYKDYNTQGNQIAALREFVPDFKLEEGHPNYDPDEERRYTEVVVADSPWQVAWYADRPCLWLPSNPTQLKEIQALTDTKGQPISGVLFSRAAANAPFHGGLVRGPYMEWGGIIIPHTMLSGNSTSRDMSKTLLSAIAQDRIKLNDMPYTLPHPQLLSPQMLYLTDPSKVPAPSPNGE
jgi:hypothetical protein